MRDARVEITELLYRSAELFDAGDFGASSSLFSDAVLTAEGTTVSARGKDEILATQKAWIRLYDGIPSTKHITTNVIVDVDEENGTATARSSFLVFQAVPGVMGLQPIMVGHYRDGFEKIDGTWRFASRHTTVDLAGDLSQHLVGAVEGHTNQAAGAATESR